MAKSNQRKPTPRKRSGIRRGATNRQAWTRLSDDELLQWRICDLELEIKGTPVAQHIEQLYEELEYRGLCFRPHFWLSDEWFSPDGVPGVAIPFYLAHPRLATLERNQMLEVEGGTDNWCLRILRHEAGHAIGTAYRLHRRERYRKIFGKFTAPYPEYYDPKPYSKNYVLHLEPAYAQAHPAEDFAETFAVWLKPRSAWRATYEEWPVIKKLEYVAELMEEVCDAKPLVTSRARVDPVSSMRKTLGEHYAQKREWYGIDLPNLYDQHLRKLFSEKAACDGTEPAATFLRKNRTQLRKTVAHWTGEYQYTIDQVLGDMIDRCRELDLRLDRPVDQAQRDALVLVTVQTMNYIHGGHHRVAL